MLRMLLLAVLLLLVVPSVAQASMLNLSLEGADVGPAVFAPLGDEDSFVAMDLTLHPFPQEGPATPTNTSEIIPWLTANLGIDIPFEGDEKTLLKPLGIGISEQVQIGSVLNVPIRAGVAWLTDTGTSFFLKGPVIEF